jgi:hypothetical protein
VRTDRDWWQLDGGEHYRELAEWLRDVARKCQFASPRRELLGLARQYERRAKVIEGRARRQSTDRRAPGYARARL